MQSNTKRLLESLGLADHYSNPKVVALVKRYSAQEQMILDQQISMAEKDQRIKELEDRIIDLEDLEISMGTAMLEMEKEERRHDNLRKVR